MARLIIAGNGNTIPPEFDASFRDFVTGTNGQYLDAVLNPSTNKVTYNGIVFARGVIGFYSSEDVSVSSDGYVYAELTMHHDPDVEDETNIIFSATALATQEDDILLQAGTYRMLIGTMTSGSYARANYVPYPNKAYSADSASVVTGSIDGNATGTTQAITDNTTKMATTKFVHDLVDAEIAANIKQSTISAPNISTTTNVCYNRLGLIGLILYGTYSGGATPSGSVVATIPAGYRPSQTITVPYYSTISQQPSGAETIATINANGNITLNIGIGSGETFKLNCSYLGS